MKKFISLAALTFASTALAVSPPTAPSGVTVNRANSAQASVSWADNSTDEDIFCVERAAVSNGPFTSVFCAGQNVTNYLDSLASGTTAWYRLRAGNCAGFSSYTTPAVPLFPSQVITNLPQPRTNVGCGIFLLGRACEDCELTNLSSTWENPVDGFAMRTSWLRRDPGTTGSNYNFTVIGTALTNLQFHGRSLSLYIETSRVPTYVLNNAGQTYNAVFSFEDGGAQSYTTSVSWDVPSTMRLTNFIRAMGDFQVWDYSTSANVALRDHPALGVLRVSVIGREHIFRENREKVTAMTGYSRALYLSAVTNQLTHWQNNFPRQKINFGLFGLTDNTASPRLDTVLLTEIAARFNGVTRARLNGFEELWTGGRPQVNTTGGANLLAYRATGAGVSFQALTDFLDEPEPGNPRNWDTDTDGTSPCDGFLFGTGQYGATYYEVYFADVTNAAPTRPFYTCFTNWQSQLGNCSAVVTNQPPGASWSAATVGGTVSDTTFSECSGIASSTQNVFWVNRDSGKPNSLYVMNTNGGLAATWSLTGSQNNDWEDISTGPGPTGGAQYIYVAEHFGPVYRILEPNPATAGGSITATKLNFGFAGSTRPNCEGFAIDWQTGDAFFLSRGPDQSPTHTLYWLADIRNKTSGTFIPITNLVDFDPNFPVTAMDISRDGTLVAVLQKNNRVHLWNVSGSSVKDYLVAHPKAAELLTGPASPLREAMAIWHTNNKVTTASERQPTPLTWWYK